MGNDTEAPITTGRRETRLLREAARSLRSRGGSALRLGSTFGLAIGLTGCDISGDACVGPDTTASQTVLNQREVTPRNCDGGFFSARNQRAVLYGGDDKPRLWTGDAPRTEAAIDPSAINVAFPSGRPRTKVTGYLDMERIDYPPDAATEAKDIDDLHNAGGPTFDPDARVTINFKKASVDYVLKQLLGGALGLNYMAPEDLGGSISFRTEERVAKSKVLQILRDLLARNGLEMRKVNGIYQVGKPELIASLETTGAAGRLADRVTRIVRLRRGDATALMALARPLLPADITLQPTNVPDTILLGAMPSDIDGAETIVKNLEASGIGADHVAIIPLHQSAPEKIAAQLNEFYRGRGVEGLTILPLDRQQGLLAATKDRTSLEGVKTLARAMDNEVRDEVSLRILPLRYLKASEMAERLAGIFGAGGGGGGGAGGRSGGTSGGAGKSAGTGTSLGSGGGYGAGLGSGSGPGLSGHSGFEMPASADSDLAPDGPRTSMPAPQPGGQSATGSGRGGGGLGASAPQPAPYAAGGGAGSGSGGNETKIVADPSSNSVMIYSSYALFKRVRDVLGVLDVPQSQVVIEATIVEVTLNDQLQQGVQFFLSGHGMTVGSGDTSNLLGTTSSGTTASGTVGGTASTGTGTTTSTGTAATGTATGTIGTAATGTSSTAGTSVLGGSGFSANNGGLLSVGANLGHGYSASAVISALQGITKVKVISSPYLTVTNGKEARLVVGDEIPYSTRTQSSNNLGNNTTTNEVTIKDTGIILDITPDIHADNEVELKISQSVSTPSETSPLGGTLTPVISTRSVDSDVLMQSGHTVLLGGLIQDRVEQSEGGVPVLRTVPLVGDLFKSKTDAVTRSELILLLTPRVTRTTSQIENLAHLLQAQIHTR